jgi:hypothetical protein
VVELYVDRVEGCYLICVHLPFLDLFPDKLDQAGEPVFE